MVAFVGWLVAVVLGTVVLAQFAFLVGSYAFQRLVTRRAGLPLASWSATLRAATREWFFELVSTLSWPFGLRSRGDAMRFDGTGGPPVVLLHGYLRNRSCMLLLEARLRRAGYANVYNLTLGCTLDPIEVTTGRVMERLAAISALAGGAKVIGIGHSLGGIVLRRAARRGAPLARIIALSSPHEGTLVGWIAPGASAREVRPGSPFLSLLAGDDPVPLAGLYTELDNIVLPWTSSAHGEPRRGFSHCGHITMVYDRAVGDEVLRLLGAG